MSLERETCSGIFGHKIKHHQKTPFSPDFYQLSCTAQQLKTTDFFFRTGMLELTLTNLSGYLIKGSMPVGCPWICGNQFCAGWKMHLNGFLFLVPSFLEWLRLEKLPRMSIQPCLGFDVSARVPCGPSRDPPGVSPALVPSPPCTWGGFAQPSSEG